MRINLGGYSGIQKGTSIDDKKVNFGVIAVILSAAKDLLNKGFFAMLRMTNKMREFDIMAIYILWLKSTIDLVDSIN
jgi:hypothetical protein